MMLRRTRAGDPERDVELPQTIDVGALHTLLHQRGRADLAALLLLRLTPEGTQDLAILLTRFRRQATRPSLFRSYRRLLNAEQAQHVDLAIAFLCGAGHAGCRVYPDPRATSAPRTSLRILPSAAFTEDEGEEQDDDQAGTSRDTADGPCGPRPIMPSWLPRPGGSSWDQ